MQVGAEGEADMEGGEMYTNCGFWWWWIWGGEGVGLGGDACLGTKLGIGEVELLGVIVEKGSVEVAVSFNIVWST